MVKYKMLLWKEKLLLRRREVWVLKHMKYVGIKQVLKAVEANEVCRVYVGKDAEKRVISKLVALAKERNIEIVEIDSMEKLGKMAGIEVKATTAAE